jgi:hypothetical protein
MKHRLMLFVLVALAGLVVLLLSPSVMRTSSRTVMTVAGHDDDDDADDIPESTIKRGFDLAPVHLNFQRKNRALVGLGSYIVNAQSGCNGCHTNPSFVLGHDPFLGQPEKINAPCYLSGGQQFGPFTSRNLTPDPVSGRPADLTFDQFLHVLRTGEDLDHEPPIVPGPTKDLLQVMPWVEFGKMSTRDIRAIYEYLKAIPSRQTCN